MEHRWSTRKSVTGNVVVECPRIGLIHAAMQDVSLGGMSINAESVSLPVNAPLAVVFDLASGERRDAYCLQAMVVRRIAGGGMGIMFLDPDAEVIRAMRIALYGSSAANFARLSVAAGSLDNASARVSRSGSARE